MVPLVLQALAIPTHTVSTASSPPLVLYDIRVTTPTSTYTVSHRYSAFCTLHASLSLLAPTPLPLPPKRASYFRSTLTPEETTARRAALEAYLRAILSSSAVHSDSAYFQDFLQPPVLSLSSPSALSKPTPQTWLAQLTDFQTQARELRASLGQRDVYASSPATSARAHQLTKDAKRDTVELVAGIERLRGELKALGLPSGEETRRRGMLGALEDDVATLGNQAHSGPAVKASAASAGFSRPAGGRVLGTSKPAETAATRALDNAGLQQLQQTYMAAQDDRVAELAASLRRQRELGTLIGEELAVQDETMRGLEEDVDKVKGKIKTATGMMRRLG